MVGLPLKLAVISVPPWKSIPSKKWLCHIEMIPGVITSSEIAKKMLRRPIKLNFRIRGSATGATTAACWTLPSSTMCPTRSCGVTSGSSDTVYSEQTRAPEPAARQHDGEQVVGHDD